eukprot:804815-Pelagomonas_calceolata.AAC.4
MRGQGSDLIHSKDARQRARAHHSPQETLHEAHACLCLKVMRNRAVMWNAVMLSRSAAQTQVMEEVFMVGLQLLLEESPGPQKA